MTIAQRCSFSVGDYIDGKFRVNKVLGDGAFGIVYKVSSPDSKEYALKVLKLWTISPDNYQNLKARFVMEYETGKIESNNLVHSYSYGEVMGNPYILMEFCPKGDLRTFAQRENVDHCRTARDILKGLSALHARGKVHRDLKPENVLIKQDGTAVLTDFGISGDQNKRMTERGVMGKPTQIFGTFAYMPPEQVNPPRGGQATVLPTTDIFSFGVMMYELIVGKLPFGELRSDTIARYLQNGKDGKWDKDSLYAADSTGIWSKIISGALEPDFHQRTQSVTAILPLLPKKEEPVYEDEEDDVIEKIDSISPVINGTLLRVMQGEDYGKVYYLDNLLGDGYLLTMGRNDFTTFNTVPLTENHSRYISRHHCTLEKSPSGEWYIRDGQFWNGKWTHSLNGTYVNSKEADAFGVPFKVGDIISVGDVKMRVEGY